jgi:hypothetical protein
MIRCVVSMLEPYVRVDEHRPLGARGRALWLRIAALALLGAVALVIIAIPGLASERSSPAGLAADVAVVVVLAAVSVRAYVLLRRADLPRLRALLIAVLLMPATIAVPVFLLWLLVQLSSS